MSGKRSGFGVDLRLHVATLMVASLALASGCGSSDTNTNAGSSANGGSSASGGSSSGGGAGGSSNGGAMNGGGGVSTSGGGTSSGGVGPGGNAGTGGAATGGRSASTGGAGGGSSGGAPNLDGGAGAGATDAQGATCKNPSHVLPLNPQNPQDGITLSGFYVDTDTWNAANYQVTQTMYICDYNDWYVVANMNNDAHDGAVKTYPNVHKDFNSSPMISSFNTISSTFAHEGPHVGIYEFAYDIWLNGIAGGGSTEVMIWTDNYKQVPSGSVLDTVMFDGETYDVYKSGSYIAFVDQKNVTSGTLNLKSFFDYVISKGWIPTTSTLGAIDYGVELVSTGGADATFSVTDFSLTTN
jgi:hypothetical protein